MARKLDLRTGRTVWSAYKVPKIETTALKRDIETDVIIIGIGISGAMAAERLTASGHKVVMIDRRDGAMLGSTPATTALVQFEIDQPLTVLTKKIGKAKAQAAYRRSRLAVANLTGRIEELGIECNATPKPSLYLSGDEMSADDLAEEAEARRSAGINALFLKRKEIKSRFGISRDGAILGHGNLALDPRKLTAGLLLKAAERGASLYTPVEAKTFSETKDGVTVTTSQGITISAKFVVIATGYELMDKVPAGGHSIISTWAIATAPQKDFDWKSLPLIWEASDPYLYLRATKDGRIICGGEDEEFTDTEKRDALLDAKTKTIARKLKALLPALDVTPEFAWAGSFGTTSTGLPLIDRLKGKKRIFSLMGYGGNGITYSQIASEIIGTAIEGGTDSDAGLYAL
ncbi:FAD-dependent oxidoreductase [Mesorhizobium sp. NBSH29]|uniref:NAD(P)/FAD-dependent oxidoreductase n=1 Tax=Mesorhizobium sp. NBSH29 TaxID=2654249 RepID=UPI00189647BE|nr:FAD-dependent oxidoreductase [Mesorhizobium sp. NBSH29]QPC85447.1 FAD-dependent oxidoreductase [Mesorhizobium sp. NBSH29]